MANLIITIISIALVTVATMMAVYYGGSAYEDATAQAAANQMISDAQQIAAAYQLYSQANGGTIYSDTGSGGSSIIFGGGIQQAPVNPSDFQFLMDQQYLNAVPQVPGTMKSGAGKIEYNEYSCSSSSYDWSIRSSCLTADAGTLPIVVTYLMIGNTANGYSGPTAYQLKVCQNIANQARGNGAPIDTTYFIDQSTSLFDCAEQDPNNGGRVGTYDFVYRIL